MVGLVGGEEQEGGEGTDLGRSNRLSVELVGQLDDHLQRLFVPPQNHHLVDGG